MKKGAILILILSVFCVLFNGCSTKQWQFNQPVENVEYIKIVRVIDIDDISDEKPYETVAHYNYLVLSTLEAEQYSELYRDIMDIPFRGYGYSLQEPYEACFLICFKNGEFDLISTIEPEHIQYKNGKLTERHSWLVTDKEVFDDLIKKYYQDETNYE